MSREEDQASAGRSGQTSQAETGGKAGNLCQGGGEDSGMGTASDTGATAAAVPAWYFRPLFWSCFLLAGIFALLGWLVWQAWQVAEADRLALEKKLALVRATNLAREDFIRQLKILLQVDPCAIPVEMDRLMPPPGIIWPPLGSRRLPETNKPGSGPAQPEPVDPALVLPAQGGSNSQLEPQAGAGTDGGKGPGNHGLGGSQTDGRDDSWAGKSGADSTDADSFAPVGQRQDQSAHGPQQPENEARPAMPDSQDSPARGMRI